MAMIKIKEKLIVRPYKEKLTDLRFKNFNSKQAKTFCPDNKQTIGL